MENCHLPKAQASCSKQKSFIVVWFDDSAVTLSDNAQKTKTELEHIVGTLAIFDDADKCIEYINHTKDLQILLIVSESTGAQVVRRVLHVSELKYVYILCSNQSMHPPWATGCKPVKCIFVDSTSICERIEIDTDDDSIDWNTIGASSISSATVGNPDKQDVKFMYSQLLKYTLTNMSYSNDHIVNLITFFEEKCNNRSKDIENVKKFQDNYANEKQTPAWCYTNYGFLYRTLNDALRTCDIDVLCTLSVFIKDLHQEIVKLYNQQITETHQIIKESNILKLYRGQVILTSEFEKIKKGGLLSFSNFLSTSLSKNVANMFAAGALHDSSSVLFEIAVDQSTSTNAFYANIQAMSLFTDEEEYLFTMGSVFRIESIEELDGNAKWCVHLTLTTDHDPELAQLADHIRMQMSEPGLVDLCTLMAHMGEFEKAVEISEAAIKASNEVSDLCTLYHLSGSCRFSMGDYQKAFAEFEIALEYARQLPNMKELSFSINMTKNMLYLQQGKLDLALTNIQSVMQNEHEYPTAQCHPEILIACNLLTGIISQRQGHFSDALSYQRTAYNTAKECLPSIHPLIGECLDQLTATYMAVGQTDEALLCMQESVQIKQDSLLPEHVSVVYSQATFEFLRHLKGDHSVSESYTQSMSTTLLKWQSDSKQNPMKLLLQGRAYLIRNQVDEALSRMDQYLSSQRENLSLQNLDLATAYIMKGVCHLIKTDLPEGLQNLRQAYEIEAQYFGETYPMRIYTLLLIANIHAKQHNDDEVFIICNQCKDLFSNEVKNFVKAFGEDPLGNIALTFSTRGLHHLIEKEWEKALSMFQKCLQIQLNFLSHDYVALGDTYSYIATSLDEMHNYADALMNCQKARDIFEKCLPLNDPKIAEIWKQLGFIHVNLEQYDDALIAHNKLLQIQSSTLPLDHLDLADTYEWFAITLCFQKKFSDAIPNCQKALDIQIKHLSPTDPKIADSWIYLGEIYGGVERNHEALYALNKALDIQLIALTPDHINFARIYKDIGLMYFSLKEYAEAFSNFQKCFDIQKNLLPLDHPDLVLIQSLIGKAYYNQHNLSDTTSDNQPALDHRLKHASSDDLDIIKKCMAAGKDFEALGQYEQSLFAYKQCLEIQMNVLPPNHLDIAMTHKLIALVYHTTKQYEEFVLHFQNCLNIQKKSLPPDHLDLADTQLCIGEVCCKLNKFSDALSNYQCGLDIQLKHLPATTQNIIKNSKKLGEIYYKLHQYDECISAYDLCLEIQFNILPSNHIDIAVTHKTIALVYYVIGQYEEALLNLRACLNIQKSSVLLDHLNLADTQSLTGDVFCQLNKFPDALINYQHALDAQLKYSSANSLEIIKSWKSLGTVYSKLCQYDDTLCAYKQCLKIQLNVLSTNHIDIAATHKVIAAVYYITKNYQEALLSFQKCLIVQSSLLPSDHIDLADTQLCIGDVCCKLNNFPNALIHYQRALDAQLKNSTTTSSEIITNLKNLAGVYSSLRRYEDCLFALNQCLEIQLSVLPFNHIDIAVTHKATAAVYYITKNYQEALLSFEKCLIVQSSSLPLDHPDRADTQSWIGDVSRKLNNSSDALLKKK
jgi:tetratricopeptide (TPR) repeat protein